MKIILLEDIKKKGKKGEVLNVKDGYGNFLINEKKAILASSNNLNKLNKDNEKKLQEKELEIAKCIKIKEKLEKEIFNFKVKVGTNDKVFGSISAKQIASILKDKGYVVDKKNIKIDNPLTSLGIHFVSIVLEKSVIAKVKIQLVK